MNKNDKIIDICKQLVYESLDNDEISKKISELEDLIMTRFTWVTYLVECSDGSIYTGITNDLVKRIEDHNAKRGAKYTKTRTPVKLLKYIVADNKSTAAKLEYKIKQMSHNDKLLFIKNANNNTFHY